MQYLMEFLFAPMGQLADGKTPCGAFPFALKQIWYAAHQPLVLVVIQSNGNGPCTFFIQATSRKWRRELSMPAGFFYMKGMQNTHWKRRLDWTFLVPFFHAGCEWADPLSNHRFTLLSFALQQFPSELAWNCWKLVMLNDACGTAVLSGTWSLQSLVAQWVSTIKVYKSYTIPLQTRWHDLTWFVYWENRLQIFRSMPSRTLLLFLLVKMVVIGFKLWHFCRNSVCSQSKAEWHTTQLPAHVRRHDNHKSWSAPKIPFYFVVFKFSSLRSEIILSDCSLFDFEVATVISRGHGLRVTAFSVFAHFWRQINGLGR